MAKKWAQLLEEGRRLKRLEGDLKWRWGDLAVEVPVEALRKFAIELEVDYDALRSYRNVAAAWPPDRRVANTSWTVHRELLTADNQHAIRPNMTLREARAAIGRTPIDHSLADIDVPVSLEGRVDAFRRLAADPEVAERAMRDSGTRTSVTDAQHRALGVGPDERLRRARSLERAEEAVGPLLEVLADLGLVGFQEELGRLRDSLKAAIETGTELPLDFVRSVRRCLGDMSMDMEVYVARQGVDAALEEMGL
jgi:hypothetical protein